MILPEQTTNSPFAFSSITGYEQPVNTLHLTQATSSLSTSFTLLPLPVGTTNTAGLDLTIGKRLIGTAGDSGVQDRLQNEERSPTRPPKGERKTTTNPKPENNNKPQARKQQQTLSHNNKTKPKQQQHNKPRTTTNPEQQQTPTTKPRTTTSETTPTNLKSPVGAKIQPFSVERRFKEIASCPLFPGSQHTWTILASEMNFRTQYGIYYSILNSR